METNLTAHYLAIETERARLPMQAERGWLIEQAVATQQGHIVPTALRRWIDGTMVEAGRNRRDHHPAAGFVRQTSAAVGAAIAWAGALFCDSRENLQSSEEQLAAYGVSWVADPAHDAELAQELKTAQERRHAGVPIALPAQPAMPAAVDRGLRFVIGAVLVHAGQRLQGTTDTKVVPTGTA